MKKTIVSILILIVFMLSACSGKKKTYPEAEQVLHKWAKAIEILNYNDYIATEVYPKEHPVFIEMYKEFYLADLMIVEADKINEKDVKKDNQGNSYIKRNLKFECAEVKRKTRKHSVLIMGDVDMIKFIDGKRIKDGWLMSNRTLIRIKR
jgi:hypothetical protein